MERSNDICLMIWPSVEKKNPFYLNKLVFLIGCLYVKFMPI